MDDKNNTKPTRNKANAQNSAVDIRALLNRAIAAHGAGNFQEAEAGYKTVLEKQPNNSEAYFHYGKLAAQCGDFDAAEQLFRVAIANNQKNTASWLELGIIQRQKGDYEDAKKIFEKVIEIAPSGDLNKSVALNNMGTLFVEMGMKNNAPQYYKQALEINSGYLSAVENLITTLDTLGHTYEAMSAIDKFISDNGESAKALAMRARHNSIFGKFVEAIADYEKALEINPDDYVSRAELLAIRCEMNEAGEHINSEISALEKLLADIDEDQQRIVYFSLFKAYSKKNEYDTAFKYLNKGNTIFRSTIKDYSAENNVDLIERIIKTFDGDWFKKNSNVGYEDTTPILIFGMPRSGTTLTERILGSLQKVEPLGELDFLRSLAEGRAPAYQNNKSTPDGPQYPEIWKDPELERITELGERYVEYIHGRAPMAEHTVDKMPSNFIFVGLAFAALPNAKLIHTTRDPVDTCLSCYEQRFTSAVPYSFDLVEIGKYYLSYRKLMDHWRSVLPDGAMLEISYEDMVADQEGQSRKMVDFCGLEWDDACLSFYDSSSSVQTASMIQVRKPVYSSSVGRWHRYERHLGPLLDVLAPIL